MSERPSVELPTFTVSLRNQNREIVIDPSALALTILEQTAWSRYQTSRVTRLDTIDTRNSFLARMFKKPPRERNLFEKMDHYDPAVAIQATVVEALRLERLLADGRLLVRSERKIDRYSRYDQLIGV